MRLVATNPADDVKRPASARRSLGPRRTARSDLAPPRRRRRVRESRTPLLNRFSTPMAPSRRLVSSGFYSLRNVHRHDHVQVFECQRRGISAHVCSVLCPVSVPIIGGAAAPSARPLGPYGLPLAPAPPARRHPSATPDHARAPEPRREARQLKHVQSRSRIFKPAATSPSAAPRQSTARAPGAIRGQRCFYRCESPPRSCSVRTWWVLDVHRASLA
jgi:hypothetical protein